MKKFKLLCVAPYEGMKDLMRNIADRREDIEMIICVDDLCSGNHSVNEYINSDVDAVISRGGTAEVLRNNCHIPTVEILVSVYDVLRAIRMARNIAQNFAIVGYSAVTNVARLLCEMLQYNIPVYTVHNSEEARRQMKLLKEQGIDLVVGDTLTIKIASEQSINAILFTSGIEGIEEAINTAKQLCSYNAELRTSIDLLSGIISKEDKKVVVYDNVAMQCFSSALSLPKDLDELLRKNVPQVISGEAYNAVHHIDGKMVFIQGHSFKKADENYCIYELRETISSKKGGKQGIQYFGPDTPMEMESPENYLGGSESVNNIMNMVNKYCGSMLPVLIDGEKGCGMDSFASYIYRHSTLNHCTFVVIDFSYMNGQSWEFLLSSSDSPLCEKNLNIYFKNLDCASREQQVLIKAYLDESLVARRNRMIFSFTTTAGDELMQNDLYRYILESMNSLVLHLAPLRSHIEDIPVLIGLAINNNNLLLGTQTIGLTPEAMQYLQKQPWEHNVDELRYTVREMVSSASSPYITLKDVQALLQSKSSSASWQTANPKIDLTQTLDEITQDIILNVLKEENMNQSQTAKRLGISRSTLWRLIKRSEANTERAAATEKELVSN